MDSLFREYASPFILLDSVIGAGQFDAFLDTFDTQREERKLWEYYIHKLPPWDDRSYDEFKQSVMTVRMEKHEKPSKEQLEATVQTSYNALKNFIPEERRG